MKKKIILFSISVLTIITGTTLTSTFANLEDTRANYNLVEVIETDTCNADGAFRLAQINFEEKINEKRILDFDLFSVFFKVGEGVVGQGTAKFKLENKTSEEIIKIKCLNGIEDEPPQEIEVERNKHQSGSFEIKIDGKSLGIVTPDDSEFPHLVSESPLVVSEENKKYLIVTGSDACGSKGAFRLVNLNFRNYTYFEKSEIDISSVYFDIDNKNLLGNSTFAGNLDTTGVSKPIEFEVAKAIFCDDHTSWPDEKFNFTLNSTGNEKYLHLQPIR